MPRTKEPRYKIGDIVQFRPIRIPPEKTGKGVVIEIVDADKGIYCTYWFRTHLVRTGADMQPCEGVGAKDLCSNCEFNDLCPRMPDIARCDISEFGQLRGEGRFNTDVCEHRRCVHRYTCGSKRFIQGDDELSS